MNGNSAFMMEVLPYVRAGYCCSQILGLLILQAQGRENRELVRSLWGLCHGMGQSGQLCGLLTGGACVLGMQVGFEPQSQAVPLGEALVADYVEWFMTHSSAQFGGPTCETILGQEAPGSTRCGTLLAECWGKILELAASYEVDLSLSRDEA